MHVFQLRNNTRLSEKKANGNSVREQRVWNGERIDCLRYIVQREDARDKGSCSGAMGSDMSPHYRGECKRRNSWKKADIMAGVEMHLRIKS